MIVGLTDVTGQVGAKEISAGFGHNVPSDFSVDAGLLARMLDSAHAFTEVNEAAANFMSALGL